MQYDLSPTLIFKESTALDAPDFFKKYPLVYKRVLKGEGPFTLDGRDEADMKRIIAMNIAHVNQDRVHKLLFKILEENIRGWWD